LSLDASTSDRELIRATLDGQSDAFGQLVLKYQDRLFNSLFRLLGSEEDARDVTQDAFVQAFLKLKTFRGAAAFYTWLYRIGFNLAMSHARGRRITQSLDHAKLDHGSEPVDGQPLPETDFAREEQVKLVHAAIGQLAFEYRQIIILREIEDCSYEQMAEILELPVGTVRSRLFRARLALRDQLAPILSNTSIEHCPLGETSDKVAKDTKKAIT
jgi:RNA polymerase sigma-70 factor (ECF subfamily)